MSNTSKPSESELVKALTNGEIKAFNNLFQLYGNRLFRFALGYMKSEPDAEELVQDVAHDIRHLLLGDLTERTGDRRHGEFHRIGDVGTGDLALRHRLDARARVHEACALTRLPS